RQALLRRTERARPFSISDLKFEIASALMKTSFLCGQGNAVKLFARDVVQAYGHGFGFAIQLDRAEKLKAFFGRAVRLHTFRNASEFDLRAKGAVQLARPERARVER